MSDAPGAGTRDRLPGAGKRTRSSDREDTAPDTESGHRKKKIRRQALLSRQRQQNRTAPDGLYNLCQPEARHHSRGGKVNTEDRQGKASACVECLFMDQGHSEISGHSRGSGRSGRSRAAPVRRKPGGKASSPDISISSSLSDSESASSSESDRSSSVLSSAARKFRQGIGRL